MAERGDPGPYVSEDVDYMIVHAVPRVINGTTFYNETSFHFATPAMANRVRELVK